MLRLDDFYKSARRPDAAADHEGPNAGVVDWDDPASWLPEDALAALAELCRDGRAEIPVYDIAHDGRCGTQVPGPRGARRCSWPRGSSPTTSSAPCREAGLLAAAYCVRQHPLVTFWRRLTRDLREHRKPPLVLVRRGVALLREQRRLVAQVVAHGCEPVSPEQAAAEIQRLSAGVR